jgi:hypothetical protein
MEHTRRPLSGFSEHIWRHSGIVVDQHGNRDVRRGCGSQRRQLKPGADQTADGLDASW